MAATLYLIATPIGNLEDITLRALRILREEVALIACEDTRQTLKLLEHFGIKKPLVSYHDHNEQSRSGDLINRLNQGSSIALVSDAGTPLVSDPGFRLVISAIEHGIPVVPIPGASAVLSALTASGLPLNEFRFIGFMPLKSAGRKRLLDDLRNEQATVVAYESPHRILLTLDELSGSLGGRPLVVARELTKVHEEFLRGSAAAIRAELSSRPSIKGEFTIVIGGVTETEDAGLDPTIEIERLQKEEGLDRMEAIKSVAKRLGLPKREVYRLAAGPDSNRKGKCHD